MRILTTLASLAAAAYGYVWINNKNPELTSKVSHYFSSGMVHTLEARYTPEYVMKVHKGSLLKTSQHSFLEPSLKFFPYVLMEVKYTMEDGKTHEGMMLWDLTDGEMVMDTKSWTKTHGFGDCINADAKRYEFKVLNVLAQRGGTADRETLSRSLRVENDILDAWLEICRRKKLIVQSGNKYRLHLENPLLRTKPETHIHEQLVTKPHQNAIKVGRHYSLSQIEKITKAAFGHDFAIRKTTDVYLPVLCIVVQNPDGSIHTSHWNALNGKRIVHSKFID